MTPEQIKQQGESILSEIADIKRLRKEQGILLKQLERQARLMKQGIDVEQIAKYGYDPAYDKRKHGDEYDVVVVYYNVVYMKDGTKVPIEPIEM